jgi:hypothetical protein
MSPHKPIFASRKDVTSHALQAFSPGAAGLFSGRWFPSRTRVGAVVVGDHLENKYE